MKPKFKTGDEIIHKIKQTRGKIYNVESFPTFLSKNHSRVLYSVLWNDGSSSTHSHDYIDKLYYKTLDYNKFWTKFNEA